MPVSNASESSDPAAGSDYVGQVFMKRLGLFHKKGRPTGDP